MTPPLVTELSVLKNSELPSCSTVSHEKGLEVPEVVFAHCSPELVSEVAPVSVVK